MVSRYLPQSKVTDPGRMAPEFNNLPRDIAALVKVIQGLFLHIFWAPTYGVTPTESQESHVQARLVPVFLRK